MHLVHGVAERAFVAVDLLLTRRPRHRIEIVVRRPADHPLERQLVPGLLERGVGDTASDYTFSDFAMCRIAGSPSHMGFRCRASIMLPDDISINE